MIYFERFQLSNGLTVLIHPDDATLYASVVTIYRSGAKFDPADRTGVAHMVEHLMCYSSANIDNFDHALQRSSAEFNAETSHDYTSYQIRLPAANIETALWIESDRMGFPHGTLKKLQAQQKVVCEEYAETLLSSPYSELTRSIFEMAYSIHPYRQMVIGRDLDHINGISLDDVNAFIKAHYHPGNAILSIAGNIEVKEALALVRKWFDELPAGTATRPQLQEEPLQTEAKFAELVREVPANMLVKAFRMAPYGTQAYRTQLVIAEILTGGASSRLNENLVKQSQVFTHINTECTEALEGGLLLFSGMVADGIQLPVADDALQREFDLLRTEPVAKRELEKIINTMEVGICFGLIPAMAKAQALVMAELAGDASLINDDLGYYRAITVEDILQTAKGFLSIQNQNTLYFTNTGTLPRTKSTNL